MELSPQQPRSATAISAVIAPVTAVIAPVTPVVLAVLPAIAAVIAPVTTPPATPRAGRVGRFCL